jgi:hypothetical protein
MRVDVEYRFTRRGSYQESSPGPSLLCRLREWLPYASVLIEGTIHGRKPSPDSTSRASYPTHWPSRRRTRVCVDRRFQVRLVVREVRQRDVTSHNREFTGGMSREHALPPSRIPSNYCDAAGIGIQRGSAALRFRPNSATPRREFRALVATCWQRERLRLCRSFRINDLWR